MFEWDEAKNRSNIEKHGVGFALACRIFEGFTLTAIDERMDYGEVREISLGLVEGLVILSVAHTDRRGRVRLISARPASRKERARYEDALRAASQR
ncbi:MAG: BrnT family toxin [Methylobacterium mesophilicum]|nr:BrnT family toxin [Methylobacterium mesophilicum]